MPAGPAVIAACEAAIGLALPEALVSFLRRWNGLTIFYYDNGDIAKTMPDAWSETLQILDAAGIATLALALREFFDDVTANSTWPTGARERANAILPLSSEADIVTYLPLDKVDAAGNCPVMKFDQEHYAEWLRSPLPGPIAPSIDEHITRSLDSMSRTRNTFMYWL